MEKVEVESLSSFEVEAERPECERERSKIEEENPEIKNRYEHLHGKTCGGRKINEK